MLCSCHSDMGSVPPQSHENSCLMNKHSSFMISWKMLVKMLDPSKCWSKSNGVHLQDGLRTVNNNDWSRIMMHPVLCDIIIVISIVSLHHYIQSVHQRNHHQWNLCQALSCGVWRDDFRRILLLMKNTKRGHQSVLRKHANNMKN